MKLILPIFKRREEKLISRNMETVLFVSFDLLQAHHKTATAFMCLFSRHYT